MTSVAARFFSSTVLTMAQIPELHLINKDFEEIEEHRHSTFICRGNSQETHAHQNTNTCFEPKTHLQIPHEDYWQTGKGPIAENRDS